MLNAKRHARWEPISTAFIKLCQIADSNTDSDEPAIPTGYRRALPEEHVRQDAKIFCISSGWTTRLPQHQGTAFEFDANYIVPIDQELTDEDACVWPRLLVMVRDTDDELWAGPKHLIEVLASGRYRYTTRCKSGLQSFSDQCRCATPEEIKEAGL